MHALLRFGACVVVLLGAVLFVGCVLVPWLGGPSLVPADLHEIWQQLCQESNRGSELDDRGNQSRAKHDARCEVVADLIAYRASLPEAVARFRDLCERRKEPARNGEPKQLLAATDAELAAHLIDRARELLRQEARRDEILRRLQQEFRQAYPRANDFWS